MGTLLLVAALQVERLQDAVRRTDLEQVRVGIDRLREREPDRAARILVVSLGRALTHIESLHRQTLAARQAHDNMETSFPFGVEEGKIRQDAVAKAKSRIEEANAEAIRAERVYEALRAGLERLGPEAADALGEEARASRSWLVRCEIYDALGRMGVFGPIERALEEEDSPVVLAAALGEARTDRALGFLDHPQWQVRTAALRALRSSPWAVKRVIKVLEGRNARVRTEAAATLHALTNTDLPPRPEVWRDWWKANGEDFLKGRYSPGAPKRTAGPGRTTFYDIPIESTRVCFVIDRSLSMRDDDRLEAAKAELKKLIERLPDGALINIVFFAETTWCFARSPRPLDRTVRRAAAAYIDRQSYASGTNLYLALEKALTFTGSADRGTLREDGLDTIVVLSDGRPTQGRLVDNELVARVTARRARYLRPVIHTVSLGAQARSLRLLSDLTGGIFRTR